MAYYLQTELAVCEFKSLPYDLPMAVDDMSLSFQIGIRNKTLWWLIRDKNNLYDVFAINKRSSSKKRWIQNPDKRLKDVQRVLLMRFFSLIPVGDHIGAYVIGKSCRATAEQHVGKGVLISLDIEDFFPSIKRSMVRHYLNHLGYPHLVSSLLADLVTYQNFVPQGAPTSGAVANLVADHRFDQHILRDLAGIDPRWTYTRYSDDIDISHPEEKTEVEVENVIDIIRRHLRTAGFRMNEDKTSWASKNRRHRVLGMVVNEKINIPRKDYMILRALIHNCEVFGFDSQCARAKKKSAEELKGYIEGKLNYFNQINVGKATRLEEKYLVACTKEHDYKFPNKEKQKEV
jgi:hypothetical protein